MRSSEINKLYLQDLKRDMEIHSNSHKMERQRKIAEESLLLEKSAIQYANENQKSKLKRLENNKAYMDYFTSCIKQNEIKRKEARHINNSEQYLGTLITNPSDSYDKFKNCFLRNRNFRDNYLDRNPLGREIISNITPYRDSSCKNDSTFFNQVTSRSIHLSNNKDSDYTKDFLYYKNKVLGYNGESHFTNEGKDVDKELRLSYNQRYNDYLLRVKEESELKAQELNKKALEERLREENRINYRNLTKTDIVKDPRLLPKFKISQDQKLMRRILDRQTGKTPLRLDQSNIYSNQANRENTVLSSKLRWNVITEPTDNYIHNKYINQMRISEGLYNFE